MAENNTRILSALSFLINTTLIYYCYSQLFEICHIFKGSISYFYYDFVLHFDDEIQHILSFLRLLLYEPPY
jgi:hypothetical protein